MATKHNKMGSVGALAGLFVGLLFWSRFELSGLLMCVIIGVTLGTCFDGLVRGELTAYWGRYPYKTVVGRKARLIAVAYIALGIYVAYQLARSASASPL